MGTGQTRLGRDIIRARPDHSTSTSENHSIVYNQETRRARTAVGDHRTMVQGVGVGCSGPHAVAGALAVASSACNSGCGGEVCCALTATHFSAPCLLSAAAGSSSEVMLSSVSASAPLVFSDSDVVVDSDDGSCAALSDVMEDAVGLTASRWMARLAFTRASRFSFSLSSFSAFCSAE